jgi:hypothetical protein
MHQEHNHGGDPTYAAYSMGCRHPDCLIAFNEYKLRLAQRKLNGEYVDLRLRENRLRAEAVQFAEQHPSVVPEPSEPATRPILRAIAPAPASVDSAAAETPLTASAPADDSGAADIPLNADVAKVEKYLQLAIVPGTKGKLNATMVGMMPGVLQMPPERIQAALDELEKAGLLAGDGTDLYLLPAELVA